MSTAGYFAGVLDCVGPYRQATLCLSYSSAAAKPRIYGVEWGGASQVTKARAARGS